MKKSLISITVLLSTLLFMGSGCFSLGPEDPNQQPPRTGPGGMFVSEDKGETWTAISRIPRADGVKSLRGVSVYKLVQDPSDTEAMYWAAPGLGMYYTYDGGVTWQQSPQVKKGLIYNIAIHPKDKCTVYITDGIKIYVSNDCSRHWKGIHDNIAADSDKYRTVIIDPFHTDRMTIISQKGRVLRSDNRGFSWDSIATIKSGISVVDAYYDPMNEDVMYATTKTKGLFRSDDGGLTWSALLDNLRQYRGANEFRRFYMHKSKPDVLFWISKYGILRSDDRGETWSAYDLVTAPGVASIYAFEINPKNDQEIYYTAAVGNKSSLYYSADGGVHWFTKKLPSDQIPSILLLHPEKENKLYLGFTIPATN
ncbi:MAG: hypothetical protein COV59_05720 [Candidatus Magasanikbacteria bacterium CG11_big_fil_rev_8_21_14_0_20_39_34]|uniref:Sortilin N-terminal domain-containing protein n=1 Tax=Candidatus Magasanikbacteria bacterium CG11_big_fil_rev_8_21_14_0_20_39_34 TaxID=1974653 RepID=A0A2H0N435_9BACT|nr:MAG: hypothetical protein COV59_05720 [Candidatus Magasanikbacteria bacterium CG11_big_fil_rev_8_21_14_0_20_39_34]